MNEERDKTIAPAESPISLIGALAHEEAADHDGGSETELTASEAEMLLCAALLRKSPAGFIAAELEKTKAGEEFRILFANTAALGATISEPASASAIIGKPLLDCFPEVCRGEFSRALGRVLATGTAAYVGEVDYREKAEARKVFIVHAFRLGNSRAGLLLQNVTHLKELEEIIRNSEIVFRTVAESAPDAMLVIDSNGSIVFANAQAERLFGYNRKHLLNEQVELLVPERLRKPEARGPADFLLHPRKYSVEPTFELRGRRSDGSEFPAQISMIPFETHQGLYLCASIRDISEPRKSREAFRQTSMDLARITAQLEELTTVASHDLQEPLRAVAGSLQLLQRLHADKLEPAGQEQLTHALEGIKRMQLLINALLEYSRLGIRKTPFSPVDLREAFKAARDNLKAMIDTSGAVITTDPLPEVLGDHVRLVQLLQNLLANAIKFRKQNTPRIHVSARQTETEWQFAVSDNGIGIDPRNLDRIFVLFQRLHGQANYPGTGIGLAICKKIVEQHGGRIWAESVLGSGSSFVFTLPVAG